MIVNVTRLGGALTDRILPKQKLYYLLLATAAAYLVTLINPVGFNLWTTIRVILFDQTIADFTSRNNFV